MGDEDVQYDVSDKTIDELRKKLEQVIAEEIAEIQHTDDDTKKEDIRKKYADLKLSLQLEIEKEEAKQNNKETSLGTSIPLQFPNTPIDTDQKENDGLNDGDISGEGLEDTPQKGQNDTDPFIPADDAKTIPSVLQNAAPENMREGGTSISTPNASSDAPAGTGDQEGESPAPVGAAPGAPTTEPTVAQGGESASAGTPSMGEIPESAPGAQEQGQGDAAPSASVIPSADANDQEASSASGQGDDLAQQEAAQTPEDLENGIAQDLEAQKQQARMAQELGQAEKALSQKTGGVSQQPQAQPLSTPGQAGSQAGSGQQAPQAPTPQTPEGTAAQLDREKQAARAKAEAEAGEESGDVDGEEGGEKNAEGAEGISTDPRPGSRLYLSAAFLEVVMSFGAQIEALKYVHEHFIGHYLLPGIPFLAEYMGFGKTEYDEPSSWQLVGFLCLLLFEAIASMMLLLMFLTPLLIAFAPLIFGTVTTAGFLSEFESVLPGGASSIIELLKTFL